MTDKLNDSAANVDAILGVSNSTLNILNDDQKSLLITNATDLKSKDIEAGLLGKIFGTNIHNAAIHIAFIICAVLLCFCGADLFFAIVCDEYVRDREMWERILPIITLALGYIFGSGRREE